MEHRRSVATYKFPLEIPTTARVEIPHCETANEVDENYCDGSDDQVEHRQFEHLLPTEK